MLVLKVHLQTHRKWRWAVREGPAIWQVGVFWDLEQPLHSRPACSYPQLMMEQSKKSSLMVARSILNNKLISKKLEHYLKVRRGRLEPACISSFPSLSPALVPRVLSPFSC